MPEKGWHNVPVRDAIYDALRKKWAEEMKTTAHDVSFTKWFNDLLEEQTSELETHPR